MPKTRATNSIVRKQPKDLPTVTRMDIENIEHHFPRLGHALRVCSEILEFEVPNEALRTDLAHHLLVRVFEQARQGNAKSASDALVMSLSDRAERIALVFSGRETEDESRGEDSPIPAEGWNVPQPRSTDSVKLYHVYWIAALITATSVAHALKSRRATRQRNYSEQVVHDLMDCQSLLNEGNFIDGRNSIRDWTAKKTADALNRAATEKKSQAGRKAVNVRHAPNKSAKKLAVEWFQAQPRGYSGNKAARQLFDDEAKRKEVTGSARKYSLETYRGWFKGVRKHTDHARRP